MGPVTGPLDRQAALTLGHALKQCGARWLEVDGCELGVLVLPSASGGYRTVVYDDTPGGSGHVLELAEGFARDWLVAPRALLVGRNAGEHNLTWQRACLSCLLSFETEPDAPSLDRWRGIGALTALLEDLPPSPVASPPRQFVIRPLAPALPVTACAAVNAGGSLYFWSGWRHTTAQASGLGHLETRGPRLVRVGRLAR